MRQVKLIAPRTLEFNILPDIGSDVLVPCQLLLKIRRIGICGSELHSYHGVHPATFYPVVQGHGFSATDSCLKSSSMFMNSLTGIKN